MNPRLFCREQQYEITLGMTFSFDPLFFERVILRDLWAGGSGEILIIGDSGRIDEIMPGAIGQVRYLGRQYQLDIPRINCRQHAKLLLRAGAEGALVWIGSGNLTFGGWGGNRELSSAWIVNKEDSPAKSVLYNLLKSISDITGQSGKEVIEHILDLSWMSKAESQGFDDKTVFLSIPQKSLASQLAERWSGRRFNSIKICTGSTDIKGEFISWAAKQFGVSEATIALDPHLSDFYPEQLEKLPVDIKIQPIASSPMPHAKFFWFEGPDGCAATFGSANCSAAAWLLAPDRGGNIELNVVYDNCDAEEYAHVLNVIDSNSAVRPTQVEGLGERDRDDDDKKPVESSIKLVEFSINKAINQLRAKVYPPVPSQTKAVADFQETTVNLKPADNKGSVWIGPVPDFQTERGTNFGKIIFYNEGHEQYTNIRWLDDEDELQHASLGKRIVGTISGLGRMLKTPEQRKILEDLNDIATLIFSSSKNFPDPPMIREKGKDSEEEKDENVKAVDPNELVKTLGQLEEANVSAHLTGSIVPGLPVTGVMRILFPEMHLENEEEEGGETDEDPDELPLSDETGQKKPEPEKDQNNTPPPKTLRNRLVDLMNKYFKRMADLQFAVTGTSTQLVQAAAFPLAVAARGLEGNWVESDVAAEWVGKVSELLFSVEISDRESGLDKHKGLLAFFRQRYKTEEREETFLKVLGDGTLWIALTAALSKIKTGDSFRSLEKALVLNEVFNEETLRCDMDADRFKILLSRLHMQGQSETYLKRVQQISEKVNYIDTFLRNSCDELLKQQYGSRHKEGDLLWQPFAGFAWAEEDAVIADGTNIKAHLRLRGNTSVVRSDRYVNVPIAREKHLELDEAFEYLY